jgi:RimJ/RimL family protein N-acetyltransferase
MTALSRRQDAHGEVTCRLRDGTVTLLRPIRADDKDRLLQGFAELSPESRYLRFHTAVDHLTAAQVRYLTEVDHHDHMAWVALCVEEPGQPGMGVARYVRIPAEPQVAEVAVTVVDRWQGRGLGTLLLGVLVHSAIANGVTVFRNYVLAENEAMLTVLERLGATTVLAEPGVYQADMALPAEGEDLPDTPAGRVFRQIAQRRATGLLLTKPAEWLRRLTGEPEVVLPPAASTAAESPMLRQHLDDAWTAGDEEQPEAT